MSAEYRPTRKPSVISRKIGEETVLYDQETRAIHVLNPTGILVWGLCDGLNGPEEIEQALRKEFRADEKASVLEDVRRILERFRDEGLLEGDRPSTQQTDDQIT